MNILIDTGILAIPDRLENTPDLIDREYSVTEPKIYPSTSPVVISVGPGQMAVVSAYWAEEGDPETQEVAVFKVLMSMGIPESGSNGCCPTSTAEAVRILRRSKMCGWELKDCSPVAVIITPGKYELEPNGAASDVILTAQILPIQEFNHGLDNSIRH